MKVFVGYDSSRQYVYDNCISSLTVNVNKIGSSVFPKDIWWRKRGEKDSTEFSVCRFLVPFLSKFQGWSIFMDDDFYWKVDIRELEKYFDQTKSVIVCQHDYVPKNEKKWGNYYQYKYSKKNWSSLMIFNNSHKDCQKLTKELVNSIEPLFLHQFKWTDNIGSLPLEYNFLVGEYDNIEDAKALHYTNGF